jgi:hypothetical protein
MVVALGKSKKLSEDLELEICSISFNVSLQCVTESTLQGLRGELLY